MGFVKLPALDEPFGLAQADCVETLALMDPECVDLIITDPAYESLEEHRKRGTTTRLKQSKSSSNEWFPIFPNRRFVDLFAVMYRVLKKNTHLYMHCDQKTMFVVKPIAEAAGFKFWKPIVWDKVSIGMGYHYRARYEFVLFFEKGKRKISDLSVPDVLEVAKIARGFPTEKPVGLERIFVEQSSRPGELICDPFMGSSSVGEAAISRSRRFFGIDVTSKALQVSQTRLERLLWTPPPTSATCADSNPAT